MGNWVRTVVAGAVMAGGVLVVGAAPAWAKNCSDFTTQADAQAFYKADTSDPEGLDGPIGPNNDSTGTPGVACESRPCPCDKTPVLYAAATQGTTGTTQAAAVTATTARTATANTGYFSARMFIIGVALLLFGAYLVAIMTQPWELGAKLNPRSPTDW